MLIWQLCLLYKNCMFTPFVIFCSAGHSVNIVLIQWEKKHQDVTRISLMLGNLVFEAV